MRISDWSSDVCSSDLHSFTAWLPEIVWTLSGNQAVKLCPASRAGTCCVLPGAASIATCPKCAGGSIATGGRAGKPTLTQPGFCVWPGTAIVRSEEHTSELQSLMRISYAVFCLKKQIKSNDE